MKKSMRLLPYFLISLMPFIFLKLKALIQIAFGNILLSDFLINQRKMMLLMKTILYGMEVTVILLISGFFAAAGIWLLPKKVQKVFIFLLIVFIPMPFCIHTLAWMEGIGGLNYFTNNYFRLTGWNISVFVQVMALLPIAVIVFYERISSIPKDIVETARILGSDSRVFLKIIIPQCKPAFTIAGIVVFVLTVGEYGIPSVFGLTIYPMEIFAEYSSSLSSTKALVVSLPMIILSLILSVPLVKAIKKEFFRDNIIKNETTLSGLTFPIIITTKTFAVLSIAGIIIPVIVLIQKSNFSYNEFNFINSGGIDVITTFLISLIAGIISLPAMYLAGKFLFDNENNLLTWIIIIFPAVIPSSLVGAALISFWNTSIFRTVYLSLFMPVFAVMVRFMPFGILIIASGLKRINRDLISVSEILVKNNLLVLFKIIVPLMMPSLALAFGSVFLLGLGELGSVVMLLPPGFSTFSVRIYGYLHYGASEMVAEISLIVLAVIISSGLLLGFLIKRRKKNACN